MYINEIIVYTEIVRGVKSIKVDMKLDYFLLSILCLVSLTCTQAKIGYFWHITDFHYDPLYTSHGDTRKNCRKADERGSSGHHRARGKLGDAACDSPLALIESAALHMSTRHVDNVDFVLWTGDVLSSDLYTNEEDKINDIQHITHLLRRAFNSQFVFPVLGHSDPPPSSKLNQLWQHWLPTEALQTFRNCGYYTIEQSYTKLRIVALNTNLMIGDGRSVAARNQWDFLEGVFNKAKHNKEMVYVVGHIPPGVDERQGSPPPSASFSADSNRRYLRLVRRYSHIIAGQFFGHLHSDSFRVIYNEKGMPVSWIMIAPSVTPHRARAGSNNPGLRLYKFDSNNGKLLDYTQFYLDLSSANRAGEAEWTAEYNLTHYYALHEVSASSLHNLAERLTQAAPNENPFFTKYIRANSVRMYDSSSEAGCDSACAHAHYCAVTRVDYAEYQQCVETAASALASAHADQSQHTSIPTIALCLVYLLIAKVAAIIR